MFAIVALKTATLDYGIAGISPLHMLLLMLMMMAIPMIPYAFLYRSLRDKEAGLRSVSSAAPQPGFWSAGMRKMSTWVHVHRHPQPLHH